MALFNGCLFSPEGKSFLFFFRAPCSERGPKSQGSILEEGSCRNHCSWCGISHPSDSGTCVITLTVSKRVEMREYEMNNIASHPRSSLSRRALLPCHTQQIEYNSWHFPPLHISCNEKERLWSGCRLCKQTVPGSSLLANITPQCCWCKHSYFPNFPGSHLFSLQRDHMTESQYYSICFIMTVISA